MTAEQLLRRLVYGTRHDGPGPRPGRCYVELVGGPLDGMLLDITGWLGDAAHLMLPMGMNGGSRSIVDSRVPAWCLAREDDPVTALRRYDRMRQPTANAIVLANRWLGPEGIIARAAECGGTLPDGGTADIAHRYKELTGATVTQVNSHVASTVSTPAAADPGPRAGTASGHRPRSATAAGSARAVPPAPSPPQRPGCEDQPRRTDISAWMTHEQCVSHIHMCLVPEHHTCLTSDHADSQVHGKGWP
ncbi:hypothetical protein ACE1SV_74020 [Streptomyces sp. E-15]